VAEPRKRRRPRPEAPRHPRCPDWLDADAKEIWNRTVALMREMNLLTRADANALARYCQTFVRWKKAELFLAHYGDTYPCKSGNGIVKCFLPFPQVSIAQKLSAVLTKLERELGLTPASRNKLGEYNIYFDRPELWQEELRRRQRILGRTEI
jgi:P27 family predicted phage terminase small subunit